LKQKSKFQKPKNQSQNPKADQFTFGF
jgi:hypothetical protein